MPFTQPRRVATGWYWKSGPMTPYNAEAASAPRRLSILGTRGIPARHGGFETFAQQLALHLAARGWEVTVYCQGEGGGDAVHESLWRGVRRVEVPVRVGGPAGTILFDWRATGLAARDGALSLTLGYNTAIFLVRLKMAGVPVLINMDGLDWKRAKWGPFARAWLFFNERLAPWCVDHLIADNGEIEKYLGRFVDRRRVSMIPYGSPAIASADVSQLQRFGLEPDSYALVVARIEPENSIVEIMRAFVAGPRPCRLAILGGCWPEIVPYHRKVFDLAQRHADRIVMLGADYDRDLVCALRYFARVYVHGHQVGGTNPSLVEALGAGNACLVRDNPFNRWVVARAAEFFDGETSCARKFDSMLDDAHALQRLRSAARARHAQRFMPEPVMREYEELLASWLPQSHLTQPAAGSRRSRRGVRT